MSCSLSNQKKIRNNYCYLYKPFSSNLQENVINYLQDITKVIANKINNNQPLTTEEQAISIFINYAGRNDKIYYLKGCDKDVK